MYHVNITKKKRIIHQEYPSPISRLYGQHVGANFTWYHWRESKSEKTVVP